MTHIRLSALWLLLLGGAIAHADVLYQDSFDNDGLATNAGTGGGAANRTIQGHSWNDDGNATFSTSGTSYTRRAILYSTNTFQSDTGFVMRVNFKTGSVGSSLAHNLSFGLISSETDLSTYTGFNPFRVDTSVYSIGANVTADGGTATRGLNFADQATVTTLDQSGTRVQFQAGQTCEVTIEIGKGGYWCYRIDGIYEASGVLPEGFDLTKNYRVAVYGQDDNGGGKAIESIQLESGYANGERAEHIKGTWSGGSGVVWQMADFKTHDTKQVTFNSGASESALHFAQSKILETVDPSLTIVPAWGDLSQDEPDNDIMLAKILEIRNAGFYVKGYSNCKNLTGTNGAIFDAAVASWQNYCDTDPEIQAFINSKPFHRGVWNSATQTYVADADGDGEDDYPERKYMFCYAEFVLKDYALRYGHLIDEWIFDSGDDMPANGDNDGSGVIEEQRIYQAFTNAIHAGNPDIPVAYNNGRSSVNYNSFPFAAAVQFEDFTFGHAYGGNNDHASETSGTYGRNYNHVTRMVETNGYVHDGGSWTWDDLVVGNYHSKVATTKWEDGPINAWEGKEADFLRWNLEALKAGGSMTWGGSSYTSQGVTQLRPWAYDLFKMLDDHLAQYQNPGAPNWTRGRTILPEAIIGQTYYHVLEEEKDFWDPEGDEIDAVWAQAGGPSWLSISRDPNDTRAWILSGVPTETDATSHKFNLRVRDVNIEARSREVELQVIENPVTFDNTGGGAPVWISSPLILPDAYKRGDYEYLIKRGRDFEDFDGDALTMTAVGGASWVHLEQVAPDLWKLSGIPGDANSGSNTVQVALSDGSQTTQVNLQITVTDAQFPPMETNSINGGAYWTSLAASLGTTDELSYSNGGTNYDYRSLMYSSETYQSDTGFTLRFNYTTGTINSSLGHNFSFGLISADTDVASYAGFNPFATDTSVYSLGVNVAGNRGLKFTNGSAVTTLDQSGTNVEFIAGASTEVVIEIGPNGAWSYSINGIEEASGVIAGGFDLSKEYHVAVYGQDDHGGGKSIQSIAVDFNMLSVNGLVANQSTDNADGTAVSGSSAQSQNTTAINGIWVTGLEGTATDFNGSKSNTILPEEASTDINNPAGIRISEYYLTTGDFTGTQKTLVLDQNLADDYFILVRGSHDGDGKSLPDNDYVRVTGVPYGGNRYAGDMVGSGSNNRIILTRSAATYDWEGVITVVECTEPTHQAGFSLVDLVSVDVTGNSGTETVTAWNNMNQVVLFGGYRGGGVNLVDTPTSGYDNASAHTRFYPSGSNIINWTRNSGGETLIDATATAFVVEWGSEWNVQHRLVTGSNGGNGADATGEYTTAAINSVSRDNTWVWGTGTRLDSGVGDGAEGCLVTLGNGVDQNATESTVSVGSEYTDTYWFDVYTMTHPDLKVDHRFKTDGNSGNADLALTVDSAPSGARFGWVYNGCNGTGDSVTRAKLWSNYTDDDEITIGRGNSGQNFPAWIQGIDFSGLNK
ncbi:hypothetical protein [Luteolibacter sp. AS25]|uniref:hypothetical protein n=1 Tax=Luteolibacter sp. AS25 TaxID=3135776 RepID=UPI00398B3686